MNKIRAKEIIDYIYIYGPVTAEKIGNHFGIKWTEGSPVTRKVINKAIRTYAVEAGVVVITGPNGFFVARDYEEYAKYMDSLEGRIKRIKDRIDLCRRSMINSSIYIP